TRGGKLLKRQRKPAVANPSFRNLTPKASMASDITHVLMVRSWLIWSDDKGVYKPNTSCLECGMPLRREKLSPICWTAHRMSYPVERKTHELFYNTGGDRK